MGPKKRLVLLMSLGGTVALFGVLILLSLKDRSNSSRIQPPSNRSSAGKQTGTGILSNAIPTAAMSRNQLIAQGHAYGRNGDWQKAFECFRQVLAFGGSSEYLWSYATAAALGAGDTNACEELCVQMMSLFGKSNNSGTAERCAKQCLAFNCSEDLLDQAVERANFTIRNDQKNRWGQLVKGMAEYRLENFSSALDWLRQPETSGMLEVSIQALSVGAMARHRLGDAEGARKALQEVDRRVQVLVRTGELGRSYDNTWDSIARGIALRWEAERLILGKASPALDPAAIAANRAKYQSVTFSLNAADQMGRQSQWVPAVEYYSKAVQDPAFDWTISEIKQDLICQKMAAVFLMTEDQTRYCELVKVLLDRKVENLTPMMQERYAQIFVSKPEVLPAELKSRALAYARRVCELPGAETNPWLCMLQGVTDYREGQYEKAVVALNQAFFAPSDSDGAARAMTYKAMACKKLGRTKEAVEATQEANALFAKQTSRSDWTNTAFYQLAMKELLGFLANGNESLKTP